MSDEDIKDCDQVLSWDDFFRAVDRSEAPTAL